jgi:alpha-glutamyl/putrescinyl thymine pyrophosphorylase clade 1
VTTANAPNTTQLLHLMSEREGIRIRRASGAPPPWTDDPILGAWSFCNVRREDDRTTRWIATNWRDPHADDVDLWFAMAVARFVNLPDTMAELGYPVPWDPERFLRVMADRKDRGELCYGPAYKIGTGGKAMEKPAYQVQYVFAPLWARRERLRPRADDSLLGWHARLKQHEGLSDFMAAQVVADMKYVAPLSGARDWMTFAASGPGSRRGLNRVLGRPVDAPWQEDNWRAALRKLHDTIAPELQRIGLGDLHAQDLQNCLCELDKYERVRLGEGKPKRRFVPRVGP